MAATNRFELILKTLYGSYECLNVFHYKQTGGTGGALELASAFDMQVLDDLAGILLTTVSFTEIAITNLDDPTDFTVYTPIGTTQGTRSGDGLPAFVAWGFRLNRATREVRNGYKRFVGVSETDQAGGSSVPAIQTALDAVELALSTALTHAGTGSSWDLVIMRVTRNPEDPELPLVGYTYTDFPVADVVHYALTTQNTRKR